MLDDWQINWELRDLPPEVWDFLKAHKFFAMIIPKKYGGLGFSAYAHSEVVRKLSTRSITAAVTAMVPNSLGPGELLMQFGTKAQQDYWLPRLARGEEIPCFGLTSPEAGSDAASMIDYRRRLPRHVRGPRGPRHPPQLAQALHHARADRDGAGARVQAARSRSSDRHRDEIGITLALVPTNLPGVEIGRRHLPAHAGLPERAELGPRRLHPDGQRHRRRRAGRQGLEDADERARRRARHFAAVAVGRGRGLHRAHHRRLCAHPRAVPRPDRQIRGHPGAARPHGRRPPICSTPRGA